jgi:hypothetical protein
MGPTGLHGPITTLKTLRKLNFEGAQLRDLGLDGLDLFANQIADVRACLYVTSEEKQFANFIERETEILCVCDELQILNVMFGKKPKSALTPASRPQ